ncbi:DNA-directed RNA polymerase subunit E'' [Candidatus Woesearchaeota archaeon]|nr:DNA-directed RNA polymerase subunit E'' [Candidatus Woesearchaeota archaeon]
MVKRYVDKNTKRFYDTEDELGKHAANAVKATSWKGRINVLNPEKSDIGKRVGIDEKGEYALKVR